MPRQSAGWLLILLLALSACVTGQTANLSLLNHNRPVLDAHNAYPYEGRWADRIERAIAAGFPVSIEQDLAWGVDPATGRGAPLVSHETKLKGGEPSLESHFFERLRPVIAATLAANERSRWPMVILHLDFKSEEPALLRAVWDLLGAHRNWLTTALKPADPREITPLSPGPLLVLTEDSDLQEEVFFKSLAAGERLRLFGSAHSTRVQADSDRERWRLQATLPPEKLLTEPPTAYRRWWNNSWYAVEEGGAPRAGEWTAADETRLRALVSHAHRLGYWIRFYTLNGASATENEGWDDGYNFGSLEAVRTRWRAAVDAGVNFIATDQYEQLGALLQTQ